ncbi:hydrogenase accessory protein [Mesobacterium pallidum]|uniref:hydrogenase accessory protein n=1 Tax=Mesobacterium pallidum TaxID=2872037 RepID=UPI001EE330A8|nr:hydrogenase accessory protein [Mesobacterium pallidum]
MGHPLIDRLSKDLGWPLLDSHAAMADYLGTEGAHVVFVPGDAARNLESADVAVILPELRMAFQGAFDCAICGDEIEAQVRADAKVLKTPSLIFYRDGDCLGGIPKVRDWDDYVARIPQILSRDTTPA